MGTAIRLPTRSRRARHRLRAWSAGEPRRWLLVVGASLAAHAALVSEVRWVWSDRPPAFAGAAMRVRLLQATAEVAVPSEDATPPIASFRPAPSFRPRPSATSPAALERAVPLDPTPDAGNTHPIVEEPGASVGAGGKMSAVSGTRVAATSSSDEHALSATEGVVAPRYPTMFSTAASATYRVTRHDRAGEGVLTWSRGEERYLLSFRAPDVGWMQSSEGGFDEAGLAPRRYEERTARGARTTNFEPEAGLIRFSSSTARVPWTSGSQDRLGWTIQLGAVLAADPALGVAGSRILLPVAGLRGELGPWEFVVRDVAAADADTPGLVHLTREPPSEHDLGIDVWIDPAAPALPVRVEWRTPLGGVALVWQRLAVVR